jgi:hypothetical protein
MAFWDERGLSPMQTSLWPNTIGQTRRSIARPLSKSELECERNIAGNAEVRKVP